jgi:cell fate (sporulation/competence/biofilm development) regulator YlbF (YheA/YmcA/DUF963 family)
MEEILKKADELGMLIKDTDVYIEFERLNNEVEDDKEASLLLKKYNEIAETIKKKQERGFTIEKFEQERFKEISVAVTSNAMLLKYIKARDRYLVLLMNIHNALSDEDNK